MPKRVDHEQRRRQIADALVRLAARDGLHAVGMRDVAAEAGISLRLVQYYAHSKDQLLLLGLRRVRDLAGERIHDHLARLPATATPRQRIEVALLATLPVDEESASLYLVYNQYFALSLTDPQLAAHLHETHVDALGSWIVSELDQDDQDPDDAVTRATTLVALTAGLGTGLLAGQLPLRQVRAILHAELDRTFPSQDPTTPSH